jgi:hypothetical protein
MSPLPTDDAIRAELEKYAPNPGPETNSVLNKLLTHLNAQDEGN